MARTNSSEHLRYRYGICLNDQCSKCKSKEIQTILARKDFVCEECGKALRECPPPVSFWGKYGKWIITAAVIVVIAAVVGIVMALNGGDKTEKPKDDVPTDTVSVPKDTTATKAVETDTVKKEAQPETKPQEEEGEKTGTSTQPPKPKPTVKVSFGRYSGPANGLGGTITVTRSYSLDLNDGSGEALYLEPGDQIQNTKFQNGRLCGGVWVHNGSRRFFNR